MGGARNFSLREEGWDRRQGKGAPSPWAYFTFICLCTKADKAGYRARRCTAISNSRKFRLVYGASVSILVARVDSGSGVQRQRSGGDLGAKSQKLNTSILKEY